MFGEIHLRNYKSYPDQRIPLRPVTVLCGANSSGKTAILKSLLLLKQSFEATRGPYLLFNGEYTENGSFQETLFRHADKRRIGLEFSFQLKQGNFLFQNLCQSVGMMTKQSHFESFLIRTAFAFSEYQAVQSVVGEIASLTITMDMRFSKDALPAYAGTTAQTVVKMTNLAKTENPENRYRISFTGFPVPLYNNANKADAYPFELQDFEWKKAACYFSGLRLNSLFQEGLSKRQMSALPVLYTLFQTIEAEFETIRYLGPLREAPHRRYDLDNVYDRIGTKGEHTAQYLSQFGDRFSALCVPPADKDGALSFQRENVSLYQAAARWMRYFECGELYLAKSTGQPIPSTQVMVGEDNFADVGFGISQSLPVVVAGLILEPQETLMVEQPEVHLHPKLQMDVADFLLSVAKQGRQIILETHSDHIVNRFARRAMEDPSVMDMVQFYFISKQPDGSSKLEEVPIHPTLGFKKAPKDFFDQYNLEAKSILNIGYRKMQQEQMNKRGVRRDETDFRP